MSHNSRNTQLRVSTGRAAHPCLSALVLKMRVRSDSLESYVSECNRGCFMKRDIVKAHVIDVA